jgi:hypothetical protein
MLRNCPTFSAAPRIRVSFDTRRVRFASVIMSEDGWVGRVGGGRRRAAEEFRSGAVAERCCEAWDETSA